MKPEIIQNGEFIEVIGHYDDEVQCAKMTLLAELYAVEHQDGYAKFRLEDADKLGLVNERLEFPPRTFTLSVSLVNFPVGVSQINVFSDFSAAYYTQDDIKDLDFISNFISILVLCTEGTTIPDFTLMGHTFTQSQATYNSDGWYEYDVDYVYGSVIPGDTPVIEFNASTPRVSIDLTTLSGWSGLSDGSHSITVKARATGYRDSEASQAVSVTKAPPPVIIYYNITATVSNITASTSNPTTIEEGGTAILTFMADGTSYKVPTSAPTITGATGVYNRISDTQCTITLSNPTGDVSFSVIGEQAQWDEKNLTGTRWQLTRKIQYYSKLTWLALNVVNENTDRSYDRLWIYPNDANYRRASFRKSDDTTPELYDDLSKYWRNADNPNVVADPPLIRIDGGSDVSDKDAIDWFKINGTLLSW